MTTRQITKGEFETISEIANRARALFSQIGHPRPKLDCMMDLEAVHMSIGLRLAELRDADDANFAHDVCGIARHLNRDTGELEDCFVPRFAVPEGVEYVA